MRKLLSGVTILGLVLAGWLLFTLPAGATGNCQTFQNHSGHIPGSYDYAEFYEDGQLVTTVQTNGQDTFVNPADYAAGRSWDVVKKCHNGTTTTVATTSTTELETTTTVQDTTTTTGIEETSTTLSDTTTTSSLATTTTTSPAGSTTTSLLPTSSSVPGSGELPFTGGHAARDAAIASSALLMGVIILTAAKGMKEEDAE